MFICIAVPSLAIGSQTALVCSHLASPPLEGAHNTYRTPTAVFLVLASGFQKAQRPNSHHHESRHPPPDLPSNITKPHSRHEITPTSPRPQTHAHRRTMTLTPRRTMTLTPRVRLCRLSRPPAAPSPALRQSTVPSPSPSPPRPPATSARPPRRRPPPPPP